MGIGVFPVFKSRLENADFDADGKALAARFETLDEVAVRAGVRRFTSFGDNREVPADFDGDPDDLEELMGEWDEWFSSTEGVHTVEALITELSATAGNEILVEELTELRRCSRVSAPSTS